ncbi:MAG: gliding motility-associated C-terminal domain-containing protein [Bacteroidia bacterium]|nr:gliding motility-associated C-terminal domain-containing protein [Bacteroidia bacterium]
MRFWAFIFIFFLNAKILFAQCTISGKREACINDLVSFSISNSSGAITQYNWSFGAYGTSSNTNPIVKFTAKGTVVLSCTATLTGGQTCSDTHEIKILPSPKAHAFITKTSQFCFDGNNICLGDSIQPGQRGISNINLLWGDGNLSQFSQPIGKTWCHSFNDTGEYNINMEVADSAGCKDKFQIKVHVAPSVKITANEVDYQFCDSMQLCLKSKVVGGKNINNSWYKMPGNVKSSLPLDWCKMLAPGERVIYKLVSKNEYGCKDSVTVNYLSSMEKFRVNKLRNILCLNEIQTGALTFYANEEVQWYLNGSPEYVDRGLVIYEAKLGKNYIKAERINGCKGVYLDSFILEGVRAVGRVYNGNRRKVHDTVILVDYTKGKLGAGLSRLWDFGDKHAARCTTWTAKNINVGKNCNFSRDSIAKHYYKDSDCFAPRLIITDSSTGCWDDSLIPIYRRNACPEIFITPKVCLGDYVNFSIPGNIYQKVRDKAFYIADTSKNADTVILYSGSGVYLYKSIGLKSPILWRYYDEDTVWKVVNNKVVVDFIRPPVGWVADTFIHKLEVLRRAKANFILTKKSLCNPYIANLKFIDSALYFPQTLTIEWGDTTIVYKNFTDTIVYLKDYLHEYKSGGLYRVKVIIKTKTGCGNEFQGTIAFSHHAGLRHSATCVGANVCFSDSVVDINTQQRWSSTNGFGNIYWDYGDGNKDTGFQKCHKYATAGIFIVKMTSISKSGCKSTNLDTVILAKPIAEIKYQPTIYCSEIRQYFDSSFMTSPNNGQIINQWRWNFGDGSSPVFVRNPAHIFSGGGVYRALLKVTTTTGCTDSVYKDFIVLGPDVKAAIVSDSMGCAPLKVQFGNLSKQTKKFIWEFGDQNNTIYSTEKDTNTQFTYKNPGVYYVHIIGGDSFYNPTTGNKYYCSVRYPAPGQKQLRVTVFETVKTMFNSPETVCLGDTVEFGNISDNKSTKYFWSMGNGDTQTRNADTFKYLFSKSGKYKVVLKPVLSTNFSPCSDTMVRTVNIVEIQPQFELDCRKTKGSELFLENKSGIDLPGFSWTLLNPVDSSEKLLSNSTNLFYDFGKDTGLKYICLGVNGGKSCGGKSCKPVKVQSAVFFANVFTPNESDGYNDTYKIPLYGYDEFEIKIFNRWGERLFYSTNPNYEWNGKVMNDGAVLPSGTYFYQVKYKPECADEPILVNGSINLIR